MQQYTQAIRDYMNEPRIRFNLIKKKAKWFRLCSSLDQVDDCDLGIEAFLSNPPAGQDFGHLYLHLYGVMALLVAQQDAVRSLCQAFDLTDTRKDYPVLDEIRRAKAASTSHATDIDFGEAFGSISRVTMRSEGFELLKEYASGSHEFKGVPVAKMIREQRECLGKMLALAVQELGERDLAHRQKFAGERSRSLS